MINRMVSRSLLAASLLALAAVGCHRAETGSAPAASTNEPGAGPNEAREGREGRRGPPDPARMIQRFDRNGDGVLQLSELPERMQSRMGSADTDHDGALSVAEITAANAQRRAMHAERPEAPPAQ